MTKSLATTRLQLNVDAWLNATTDPSGVVNSPAGSWLQRSPAAATDPVEIYLNTSGGADGWVKQNLVFLDVFNVKDYGAVGNGVTGDCDAIWACLQAANTAGGGVVYFPPGSYIVEKRLTALASFAMADMHNIVIMGDGFASKILMSGNAGGSDWYLFYLTNGTSGIKFMNLYMDGAAITNPDPGEQTHLVFNACETTNANGGAHDNVVTGCYFGAIDGDVLRTLGTRVTAVDKPTYNHLYEDNSVISPSCRTCISIQRYSHKIKALDNFCTGSNDQNLDMEPTGGTAPDNTPKEWIIVGNQLDHSSQDVVACTLNGNGATGPSTRSVFAFNSLYNFSVMEMRDASLWSVVGNILIYTAALGGDVGINLVDGSHDNEIIANVFDRPNHVAQQYKCVTITPGSSTRSHIRISDNVGRSFGTAAGGQAISATGASDLIVEGNVFTHDNATGNVSALLIFTVSTEACDGIVCRGNMVISINAAALSLIQFGTTGAFTFGNCMAYANYGRGAGAGHRLVISGGGSFVDWRGCYYGNFTAISANITAISGFSSGVTIEGNAGPAPRFVQFLATPVAAAPAVSGSVAMNTGGTAGTILFYKETAASPTDTAGCISTGPGDTVFSAQSAGTAATALFLATGMALVTASATEIQMAAVRPGTMRAIRVQCVAGVGAATVTYTYRKNGVDQALTAAISNTVTNGSGTGAIAFVAGDLHSVKITKSAGVATGQSMVSATLEQNG